MGEDRAAEKTAAPADRAAHAVPGPAPVPGSPAPSIGVQRLPELAGNGSDGQVPANRLLGGGQLLQLQSLAGNRAVSELVQRSVAPAPSVPWALQRQAPAGPAAAPAAPGRKHTFKLPDIELRGLKADFEYAEVKDGKLGGEFGLEPVQAGGGETAGKGGVVLGPGEAGYAAETAEREINARVVPGLDLKVVKGTATATNKELSFGAQADFQGEIVTTEVKLNVVKFDIEKGDYDILSLTFNHNLEKFLELPGPITIGGYQYKLSFKPFLEWSAAAKWTPILRDIAKQIGPELLAEAAFTLGPILVAVGTVAGVAYELYYADEFRELPAKMFDDTRYTALASVKALYGDPGYEGEPYKAAYAEGQKVLGDLKAKLGPKLVNEVLRSGARKDVMMIVDKVPYDALFDAAHKRAIKTWTDRHSLRASILGVPGTIERLNQNRTWVDRAREEVKDYVLIKTREAELPR